MLARATALYGHLLLDILVDWKVLTPFLMMNHHLGHNWASASQVFIFIEQTIMRGFDIVFETFALAPSEEVPWCSSEHSTCLYNLNSGVLITYPDIVVTLLD